MEKSETQPETREASAVTQTPHTEQVSLKHLPSQRMGWVIGIGTGVAVGLLSAAQSIRNKFYEDTKSWEGIPELRAARDKEFRKVNGTESNPQNFKIFSKEFKRIEQDYTRAHHQRIKIMGDIEMDGWRGLTVGTWKRFRIAGVPTKIAAGLSLVTAAAVATSAIFSFDARRRVIELADKLEEKGHGI